jgi:hypothetical protein
VPNGVETITNLRSRQTVPAGTFDTVEYVRTSQSRDVYWKSTVHGVIVKHRGVRSRVVVHAA